MTPELRQQMRLARAALQESLACQVPGCRVILHGATGLDEINKLRRHYKKAHLASLSMGEALTLRVRMEDAQTAALSDLRAAERVPGKKR